MTRSSWPGALLLCALLLAGSSPSSAAERLHLDNGGHIDVLRSWTAGSTLYYEDAGGTVGIPRSMVVRIERIPDPLPSSPKAQPETVPDRSGAELRAALLEAKGALERRDFEMASSRFWALIQDRPDLYTARVGYAVSQIELENDGLALSVVLDGISRDPARPELYVLLGQLRYREDRLADALRAWTRAFELAPTDELRDLLIKVEREMNTSQDLDFSASTHFNLHYDGSVDLDLAHAVLDYLEEQYWLVTQRLRHSPTQPITVQLLPTPAFRDVTQAPEWVGGLYDGKIRVPLGGLTRLTPDAKRVLVHELTHAVIHSKSRGGAPRWMHEGLAQMAEGKHVLRSEIAAIVDILRTTPPDQWGQIPFSYARALSLTEYLAGRSGYDRLVEVLDRIGRGADADQALREVYGLGHDDLCKAWGREIQRDTAR